LKEKRKDRQKPRKVMSILLLPAAIFIWAVGWALMWIGSQGKPKKDQGDDQKMLEDNWSFEVLASEEKAKVRN
jgi:nitrogen fixation-related uncharacterized protein